MIAATYTQGGSLAFEELPIPQITHDEMLVRIKASSICGTDVRIIQHGHRKLQPGQKVVLGHEFAGIIEQVGANVRGYREGQRVGVAPNMGCGRCEMCARGEANLCPDYSAFGISIDGAHAEYVRIPQAAIAQGNVVPLPESVGWTEASLIEPLSCVVNGLVNCQVNLGDTVAVFGAGPIGLFHLMLALVGGASRVFVIDTNTKRLAQANKIVPEAIVVNPGEVNPVDAVLQQTAGRGADVVVTACSVAAVQEQSLALLAPHGRLSLFGGLPKDSTGVMMNTNLIHYRNLKVTGTTGGPLTAFRTALRMVETRRIDVSHVVSHAIPAAQMHEAFDMAQRGDAMKVVILYGD